MGMHMSYLAVRLIQERKAFRMGIASIAFSVASKILYRKIFVQPFNHHKAVSEMHTQNMVFLLHQKKKKMKVLPKTVHIVFMLR